MTHDKQFYLISLISTYVYIKEKHENIPQGLENKSEDQNKILSMIEPLDKFIVIPDKLDYINRAYSELSTIFVQNQQGQVAILMDTIKEYSSILKQNEKEEILNILFYVVFEDKKISQKEKETVIRIANVFNINGSYEELLEVYKKSPFSRPFPMKLYSMIFAIVLALIIGGFYYQIYSNKKDVKIFKDEKIVFDEISFNRFIIYKNKFGDNSNFFKRQVVFYISGKAEIGFDPKNINYNEESQTLTYTYPKVTKETSPFDVSMNATTPLLIDEIQPTKLSKEKASKISTAIGIAGGILGAKVGSSIGSKLPYKHLSQIVGAVVGGATVGLTAKEVSFDALKDLKLKNISIEEKDFVQYKAKLLLLTMLKYNKELLKIYEDDFKMYIKRKYASYGKTVTNIVFKEEL